MSTTKTQETVTQEEIVELASERVELKNLEIASGLSEETLAFSATVYLDGEIVAKAKNRGRGGATMLTAFMDRRGGGDPTRKENVEALKGFASTLPLLESFYSDNSYNVDAESLVSYMAEHEDFMRTVKRHINNGRLVFRTSDQDYGAFHYADHRGNPEEALEFLKGEHDIVKVYNEGLSV